MSTTARAVEETFRRVLAAGIPPGIELRLRNETSPLRHPAVILSAEETGDFLGIKAGGRVAKVVAVDLECRVLGSEPESARSLEALGGSLENLLAAAAGDGALFAGWAYLRFLDSTKKYEFDGHVRVLTASYQMHALTSV